MLKSPIFIVGLLWCAGLGAAAQFSKLSLVFLELEAFYLGGQAAPWFGFILSIISVVGILFGLTSGFIVARVGFRRMLLWGVFLGAGIAFLEARLLPLPVMMCLRLIEGASHLVITVAAPTLIAQLTVSRYLPLAMSLWSTFFGVAYALTVWLGTPLVAAYGVESLFYAHGIWMLCIGAVLWAVLPANTASSKPRAVGFVQQHIEVYQNPATGAPALAWLCYTLTFVSLITVLPSFISEASRSLTLFLMPLAGIATSMTLGVALLRFLDPVKVVVIGFICAGLTALMFMFAPAHPMLCVLLFASLGLVQGANFAAIPALNQSDEARAHCNGAVAQMGNLGNTFGTPVVLGLVAMMGFGGIILFALVAYGLGIAVHVTLAKKRSDLTG